MDKPKTGFHRRKAMTLGKINDAWHTAKLTNMPESVLKDLEKAHKTVKDMKNDGTE